MTRRRQAAFGVYGSSAVRKGPVAQPFKAVPRHVPAIHGAGSLGGVVALAEAVAETVKRRADELQRFSTVWMSKGS